MKLHLLKNSSIFLFVMLLLTSSSFYGQKAKTKPLQKKGVTTTKKIPTTLPGGQADGLFAELETTKGKIVIQLEYKKTPVTVANFVALAEGNNPFVKAELKGKPFYNGLKFHRVIPNFMIQGGDPLGTGSGDPGYKFKDEITDLKHSKAGILSMANSGPNTNGSQFFITHKETPWLDGKHTVFGEVTTGMDVVNAIVQNDVINKITIVRKGAEAKAFDAPKVFAAYFKNKDSDERTQLAKAALEKSIQDAKNAELKKKYIEQYGLVMAEKVKELATVKATATTTDSGLQYAITKANGKKPGNGTTVYVHYAGYFEDGSLFDSSYEEVSKRYGKFDQARADQKGYQPFPFQFGNAGGLIPGFLEGLNLLSFGDKATLFIPSKLGYGEQGAGGVIPPNANLIFEIELMEQPSK